LGLFSFLNSRFANLIVTNLGIPEIQKEDNSKSKIQKAKFKKQSSKRADIK
jgi:hypothetical protein